MATPLEAGTTQPNAMVDILEPKRPQGPEASAIEDYFYVGRTEGLTLYPGSDSPIVLPKIDFCFGEDTLLESDLREAGENKLSIDSFRSEFMQPLWRLMNWSGEDGEKLVKSIIDRFMSAKHTAYINCHGDTHEEEGNQFWGLSTIDVVYGADRVIKAFTARDYDLIFMTACNPDGLPLEIEKSVTKRPTIIYFNVTNQWGMKDDKKPISIIEAIE